MEIQCEDPSVTPWLLLSQGLRGELVAGRAALWEDVAQRVGVLLSAPAAFAGEHFVQVESRFQSFPIASVSQDCCVVGVLLSAHAAFAGKHFVQAEIPKRSQTRKIPKAQQRVLSAKA